MSKAQKALYKARFLFVAAQEFEATQRFEAAERYKVESQVLAQQAFVNHMMEFEAR